MTVLRRWRDVEHRTLALVAGLFLLSTAGGAYEIAPASVVPLVREGLQIESPNRACGICYTKLLTRPVFSHTKSMVAGETRMT